MVILSHNHIIFVSVFDDLWWFYGGFMVVLCRFYVSSKINKLLCFSCITHFYGGSLKFIYSSFKFSFYGITVASSS